jgi:cold shock CspA family protein/ribosome-associated translation inhibitor RaiA
VAWLEKFYDRLIGCDVVVEAPHRHSRQGNLFAVTVELHVPGGAPVVAGRLHHDDHSHEDVYVAIRDTFDAARRRLQDHARRARGDIKAHEAPLHGRVAWIDGNERYGFITASDETEIYFHENALVDLAFDDLRAGDEVRFDMHAGEGARGPQASTVHRIGKHHPTE